MHTLGFTFGDTLDYFDIALVQAVLFEEATLFAIAAQGGGFVAQVQCGDPTWREWTVLTTNDGRDLRGFGSDEMLRALRLVTKFDIALCERVHNFQRATDLDLQEFWIDPSGSGIRLVERSYSLLATDFGQFVVLFCFRFKGGDPQTRAKAIRTICTNRAIRSNTGQKGFSDLALRYANEEVERLCIHFKDADSASHKQSAVAPPIVHGRLVWIRYEEDLTAYPWIMAGELSEEIVEVFSDENPSDSEHRYFKPEIGSPCCIIANDFSFYCEGDERRPMRNELLPVFVFMQASYYTTRQLQALLVSQMRQHSSKHNRRGEHFERLAIFFDRVLLGLGLFVDSRIPKVRSVAQNIISEWSLDKSQARLAASIEHHRRYVQLLNESRAHRDAGRQEMILFVIAVLQIFSLIGVVSDYKTLNPALPDNPKNGKWIFERWIFSHSPWLLRVFLILVVIITIWRYFPTFINIVRRIWTGICRAWRAIERKQSTDPQIDRKRFRIGISSLNNRGLFSKRLIRAGDQVFQYAGGKAVAIDSAEMKAAAFDAVEWNATNGFLHVRTGRGTPYRMINHNRIPNCKVVFDEPHNVFSVVAVSDIKKGQELTLDYRKEPLTIRYRIERGGYL